MSSNNLPSITVSNFLEIVKQQFNENNFRPIFGLGKGGIGKTESIMDLALNELKVGYIDIRLLLYGETDLKGIPYPDSTNTKTVWLQNNILPNAERDGERGILVFDEITSCARSVRTAAYQLLNERRLGEYVLPQGWMVVCLGNGEDDGGDFEGMEGNFANRCSAYNVVPDLESWKKWAVRHNINPLVIGYVSFKPEHLHSYNPESETDLLFASPRSWKAVSDIINIHGYSENDVITNLRIQGNLGLTVAQQFLTFAKLKDKAIDPMDILRGLISEVSSDLDQEVIYITIQSIARLLNDMVLQDMQNYNNACTEDTIECLANGLKWLMKLPRKEYTVMGIQDLINYNKDIMRKLLLTSELNKKCPELLQFAKENSAIFM